MKRRAVNHDLIAAMYTELVNYVTMSGDSDFPARTNALLAQPHRGSHIGRSFSEILVDYGTAPSE